MGGMIKALAMSTGGAGGRQGDRVYQFATGQNIFPYVSNDLISRMKNPVRFRAPTIGEAKVDLVRAIGDLRKDGAVTNAILGDTAKRIDGLGFKLDNTNSKLDAVNVKLETVVAKLPPPMRP